MTREAILETVLELGIDKATVSAVAERVGVDPSTLYGHVAGRGEMVAAAAEVAISRVRWRGQPAGGAAGDGWSAGAALGPAPGGVARDAAPCGKFDGPISAGSPADVPDDWRGFLTSIAEDLWGMYREHPGLAGYLRTTDVPSPTLLALAAGAVEVLTSRYGLGVPLAALAVDSVGDSVIDSFLTVTRLEQAAADDSTRAARDEAVDSVDLLAGHTQQEYVEVLKSALGSPQGSDAWWRDKVQLVLDGVAYRLLGPATG